MIRDDPPPHGYLARAAVVAGLAIAAALALNVVVDPYRIVGTPTIAGLNEVKPRASQRRAAGKRLQVLRVAPRTLVLGNSRAEVGFDPESDAWPAAARPIYNLALPGTGIATARDELARLLVTHKPERLVIGVEFVDFLTDPRAAPAPPREPVGAEWERLRTSTDALFSLDALADSARTIVAQRDRYAPDLTALGLNPMREYVRYAADEGYFGLFRQRYLESRRDLSRAPRTIRNDRGVSPDLVALEDVLATAQRLGMRVDLVLYPYHGTQLLLFDDLGLWPAFDAWKRDVAIAAARYPGVTVADFAVIDEFTRQPIPGADERPGKSPWYWEAGHFKRELGDRVLREIAACAEGQPCASRLPPSGPHLDAHLAGQRALLDAYRSEMRRSRVYGALTRSLGEAR